MKEANPYQGEVGVDWEGRHFVFRPSFLALTKLGTPKELVDMLNKVQQHTRAGFVVALAVLDRCYKGRRGTADRITGHYRDDKGKVVYAPGAMSADEVRIIGARLLINGMVGKPGASAAAARPCKEFDPAEFIAAAVAHLQMRPRDAERMTMLEFQKAMDAKFPKEKPDVPDQDGYDDLLAAIEANKNG
jgi:hypothetical protein